MLTSFTVVYHLAQKASGGDPVHPALLQRARLMRGFSNELVVLCNEYARRIPEDSIPSSTDRRWVDRTFRRDLQFLQQRMSDTMHDGPEAFLQLKSATAKCGGMARHAEDQVLRRQTLREVRQAAQAAEAYLESFKNGLPGAPPPAKPHFGEG